MIHESKKWAEFGAHRGVNAGGQTMPNQPSEVDPILRRGKRKVKLAWSRLGCDLFRSWMAAAQGLCSAIEAAVNMAASVAS
jgi:hypothetical protein